MKLKTYFAPALAVAALVLTACGSAETPATETPTTPAASAAAETDAAETTTRSITHDSGTTEISGEPKNVVALEFSFVDSLLLLGTDPVGIADDEDASRIAQLAGSDLEYTSVGTRAEPNQEVIASLKPDLIIADTDRHSEVYAALSEIAPTIVLNSREGSYQDMKDNTVIIADALGKKDDGVAAVAAHEKAMEEIASKLPADEARTVQLATARADLLRIHTSSSFVGSVMEAVGAKVAVKSDEAYEDASLERIAEVNPDVLFIASDVDTPITDTWKDNPVWTGMKAVSTDQVHEADRNLFTRFRGLKTAETIGQQIVDTLNETR
ncbi:MAG: Fe(3+) dicitrate ABC transporter substrate-binding protein [Ancrocorticia sp.]